MKKTIFTILLFLILTGCTTINIYYYSNTPCDSTNTDIPFKCANTLEDTIINILADTYAIPNTDVKAPSVRYLNNGSVIIRNGAVYDMLGRKINAE